MLSKSILIAIVSTGIATLLIATPVASQEPDCPVACVCNPPNGCHCETFPEGGGATDCVAGGLYDCQLIVCVIPVDTGGVVFTPDGAAIRFADLMGRHDEQQQGEHGFRTLPGVWGTASEGQAVARSCGGIIVARYFSPSAAAAIRERSRRLTI